MANVTIELNRTDLLYHVEHLAHQEGAVLPEGDPRRTRIQDIATDDFVDLLTLAFASAWSDLKSLLHRRLPASEWSSAYGSDRFSAPDVYSVVINGGLGFHPDLADPLARAMHDYMVYRSMAEWMAVLLPEKAAYYTLLASNTKDSVLERASFDDAPLSIRPYPPF